MGRLRVYPRHQAPGDPSARLLAGHRILRNSSLKRPVSTMHGCARRRRKSTCSPSRGTHASTPRSSVAHPRSDAFVPRSEPQCARSVASTSQLQDPAAQYGQRRDRQVNRYKHGTRVREVVASTRHERDTDDDAGCANLKALALFLHTNGQGKGRFRMCGSVFDQWRSPGLVVYPRLAPLIRTRLDELRQQASRGPRVTTNGRQSACLSGHRSFGRSAPFRTRFYSELGSTRTNAAIVSRYGLSGYLLRKSLARARARAAWPSLDNACTSSASRS